MAGKTAKATYQWRRPAPPAFQKLAVGEILEGVYLGKVAGEFGNIYRFRKDDGETVALGGRTQLDSVMADLESTLPDGGIGSRVAIRRTKDAVSRGGRTVHQYEWAVVDDVVPF
jgi:hypothetical protein